MISRHLLWAISLALTACGNSGTIAQTDEPDFAMANAACEYRALGTAEPPNSGTPAVIDATTGTVIAANFFNSGAITNPDTETVEVCVLPRQSNGQQTSTITTDVGLDDNTLIKAYPEFIIGSKFGNMSETSFRDYNRTGLPAEDVWPVTSTTGFELANLEYVSSLIGLPAFTNSLPDITVTLDMDEQNVVGANRDVMLESWFYDTSANSAIIGDNAVTNTPLSNSLNNIIGIGHPSYDVLDNTLLEMMVHVGALSPYDISGSARAPGQQRLTENLDGMPDSDLDCINDAVDVDITGGPDDDGDGIDDTKLAPVMIGPYVYSLWYGTTDLAPIVIFSRETNEFCEYGMDLSTEGEIRLNWNDFINYTLYEIEPLLQAANVTWVTGPENPFPKMRAAGGAIGGLEFGVEPQTNTLSDQPYIATINKYDVRVDGLALGLSTADTVPPATQITYPATNNDTVPGDLVFTGTTTDTGGSGIKLVRALLIERDSGQYYNFNTNMLGNTWTQKFATLMNTAQTSTDWQLSVSLPPGNYRLLTIGRDNANNEPSNPGGIKLWTKRDFTVELLDPEPVTDILFPVSANDAIPSQSNLQGRATDAEGSGFLFVSTIIYNQDTGEFYDADSNTLSSGWKQNIATLTNTTNTATDWQLPVTLPPGFYRLFAITKDAEGREPSTASGARQWTTRNFTIAQTSVDPVTEITFPVMSGDAITSPALLTGRASDPDGSGFAFVRTVLINLDSGDFYDASTNSLSAGWKQNIAVLSNTTDTYTDWQLQVTLPNGNYRLLTIARDQDGNEPTTANSTKMWTTRVFSVTDGA